MARASGRDTIDRWEGMPFEQRIGERFDIGDVPVRWRASRPGKLTRAQRRRIDPDRADEAYLRNASMSGAALLAGSNPAVGPGTAVEVRLDTDAWFLARVRRVLSSSDPRWTYYGLVYTQVSDAYQMWLNALVDRQRAELTETTWRTAE